MRHSLVIIGIGGQTSIGLSIPAISAAVRSDINCFYKSGYFLSAANGTRITVAALDTLPKDIPLSARMKTMALEAAKQALAPISGLFGQIREKLPVIISLPSLRPGFEGENRLELAREIITGLPVEPDRKRCSLLDTGHTGVFSALFHANELMRDGLTPLCLVGGADSHIDIGTLHWLEAQGRLKGEDTPNGLIPGEGAGFLLVCPQEYASRMRLRPLAGIIGVSQTIEPKPWYSGEATIGKGLTDAFWQVFDLSAFNGRRAEAAYGDLNGESWRADEWGFAYLRTGKRHGEPLDLRHPADCWGDVGAASGALLTAMAVHDFSREYSALQTALIFCASDTRPARAACLLERVRPTTEENTRP